MLLANRANQVRRSSSSSQRQGGLASIRATRKSSLAASSSLRFASVPVMSESEEPNSDQDSSYEVEGSDDNVIGQGQNAQIDCSSEEEIDDETLFKSLKILRRVSKSIIGNSRAASRTRKSTRQSKKDEGRCSKRQAEAETSSIALSRFNHGYFKKIIDSLSPRRREVVSEHGFEILLEFDGCSVLRPLVEYIADHIDESCSDIHASGKVIPLTPSSVNKVLGIRLEGRDIGETGESGKAEFLQLFNIDDIPNIKSLGSMILSEDVVLSDDQFFRCFMAVALSTFLCLNSNTKISPKYLKLLIDISTIRDWDWSKFVFDWLLQSVKKFKKRRHSLGGCMYFLAVYRKYFQGKQ